MERSRWPYTAFERHLAGWLLTATVEHEDRCRRVGEDRVIASTRIWRYLHMEGAITTWHARLPATRRRL